MISPRILVICIELRWRQLCSDPVAPCTENGRKESDLTAVPHAGLGYHVLRVQVRKPDQEVEVHQVQRGHQL